MKNHKTSSLLLVLILPAALISLSGCGKSGNGGNNEVSLLTPQQAEEYNTVDNLLQHYKTITYAQLDYIGGDTVHLTFFKNDAGEPCMVEDDNGYAGLLTDALVFSRENGESAYQLNCGQQPVISNYLLMAKAGSFTSQTLDSNGNIRCEIKTDIDQEYAESLSDWSVTTEDKLLTTAVFAGDDHRTLSLDFAVLHPDGSMMKIASSTLLYDAELSYPEAVNDYLEQEKLSVTVKLTDGSERLGMLPKGAVFTWVCDEGYALYSDESGKSPLPETSEPLDGDKTFYVLEKQS